MIDALFLLVTYHFFGLRGAFILVFSAALLFIVGIVDADEIPKEKRVALFSIGAIVTYIYYVLCGGQWSLNI